MLTELHLREDEIRHLNYQRFHYPCPRVQKRLHAVYLKATQNKMSNSKIGELVDLHCNSVSAFIRIYRSSGIEGLYFNDHYSPGSELDSHSSSILESLSQTPVCSINQAILRIEELTGIRRKPTQVRAFLHKHGFKYRKMGSIPGKVDPEQQKQFLERDLHPVIEQAKQGLCHLLFCDAAHFTLSCFICMIWSLKRVFLKTSHGRNRMNVLGAVNAITKEVTTLINTTYVSADTIKEFLDQLKMKYPSKPITLVLDNAKYQHCETVKEKAEQLGITLLFLPPYSPNLNIIERIWKFTKKKILYAKYYENALRFHQTIMLFFEQINQKHNEDLKKLLTLKFQLFDNTGIEHFQAA